MKRYYPLMLDLTGKLAVVIGGGKIAARKVGALLDAGASVTVVSPELTGSLQKLHTEGSIIWKAKPFESDDITDAFIIIAATDKPETNLAVRQAADSRQLVSLADNPDHSNFHVPAVIRRGRLTIAVSTAGASPTLAKKLSEDIGKTYDERYESYLDFLFECRGKIIKEVANPAKKRKLLAALTDSVFLENENREELFIHLFHQVMEDST